MGLARVMEHYLLEVVHDKAVNFSGRANRLAQGPQSPGKGFQTKFPVKVWYSADSNVCDG